MTSSGDPLSMYQIFLLGRFSTARGVLLSGVSCSVMEADWVNIKLLSHDIQLSPDLMKLPTTTTVGEVKRIIGASLPSQPAVSVS